jgi:hypothetical protein
MSFTGQTIFNLQEKDDSYDGEGWLKEIIVKQQTARPININTKTTLKIEKGFSATHKVEDLI